MEITLIFTGVLADQGMKFTNISQFKKKQKLKKYTLTSKVCKCYSLYTNKLSERNWLYDWADHYSRFSVYIFLYADE